MAISRAKAACPGLAKFVLFLVCILLGGGLISGIVCAMYEPLIGLCVFVGALFTALVLWVTYLIAAYFYSAAFDKGYTEAFYLKLAFWIPIAGYLLVIALPQRTAFDTQSYENDTLPDL